MSKKTAFPAFAVLLPAVGPAAASDHGGFDIVTDGNDGATGGDAGEGCVVDGLSWFGKTVIPW